jgi:hypothetical protein
MYTAQTALDRLCFITNDENDRDGTSHSISIPVLFFLILLNHF